MADFEKACAELKITLLVLPPKKSTYNGGAERGNRIFRAELYSRKDLEANTIGEMRIALNKAIQKYNTYRPHKALHGLTLMEYILQTTLVAT